MSGFTSSAAIRSPSSTASALTPTIASTTATTSRRRRPRQPSSIGRARNRCEQPFGARRRYRRQAQRAIAEQFGQHAAGGDHDERTELRVAHEARAPVPRPAPRLRRPVPAAPSRCGQRAVSSAHGGLVGQSEQHAAELGLVRDAVRLEYDRVADRVRGRDRVVRIGHELGARDREAVVGQQREGFDAIQRAQIVQSRAPPVLPRGVDGRALDRPARPRARAGAEARPGRCGCPPAPGCRLHAAAPRPPGRSPRPSWSARPAARRPRVRRRCRTCRRRTPRPGRSRGRRPRRPGRRASCAGSRRTGPGYPAPVPHRSSGFSASSPSSSNSSRRLSVGAESGANGTPSSSARSATSVRSAPESWTVAMPRPALRPPPEREQLEGVGQLGQIARPAARRCPRPAPPSRPAYRPARRNAHSPKRTRARSRRPAAARPGCRPPRPGAARPPVAAPARTVSSTRPTTRVSVSSRT